MSETLSRDQCWAILDSGCTAHYISARCPFPIDASAPTLRVALPTGAVMSSSGRSALPLAGLPPEACSAHVFPDMATFSLLSVGQLCDSDCHV